MALAAKGGKKGKGRGKGKKGGKGKGGGKGKDGKGKKGKSSKAKAKARAAPAEASDAAKANKNRLCPSYLKGTCQKEGKECQFSHSNKLYAMKTEKACTKFLNNTFERGKLCSYSHADGVCVFLNVARRTTTYRMVVTLLTFQPPMSPLKVLVQLVP